MLCSSLLTLECSVHVEFKCVQPMFEMQCNEIDFKVIGAKMLMGLKTRQDGFKLAKVLIRIIFFLSLD